MWQGVAHIFRQDTFFGPMSFIGDDDDFMAVIQLWIVLAGCICAKLLHEREEYHVCFAEQTFEVRATSGLNLLWVLLDCAGMLKILIDLVVKVLAIGDNNKCVGV